MQVGGYLVLGLLLDEPGSGYELGTRASTAVAYFWPITRAHIYTELPKLVGLGYATAADVPQQGVPDKRVYTATDAGKQAFRDWLGGFDTVTEKARQPLQIKLYFARHMSEDYPLAQLDLWEDEVRRTLAFCVALLEKEAADLTRALTIRFAIKRAESDLEWITEARAELAASR
jgi:DNA-binding PadR family transcriptional regulator